MTTPAGDRARRVAIIGAGWAGLTAAIRIAQAGAHCTIFEAARTLGGRARCVDWETHGQRLALDNGQHILIGAYRRTLGLLREIGIDPEDAFDRRPLHWADTSGWSLRATTLRAPWHLVWGIVFARGLPLRDRFALARFLQRVRNDGWRTSDEATVARLLDEHRQPAALVAHFWEPLCIAALNTPVAIASAQVFLNVLRDSLGADARDSDFLLPSVDLGSLLPDAAADYLTTRVAQSATVATGRRVQNVGIDERGFVLTGGTSTVLGDSERFDGLVIATPPAECARLLAPTALRDARYRNVVARCGRFAFQPIATAYLLYRESPRWESRMIALTVSAPHRHFGQWAFDRSDRLTDDGPDAPRGLVAIVISADGPHRDLEASALIDALAHQLAVQCGLPSAPLDARLIVEKRATFACTPDTPRIAATTPDARLVLCGDHVGTDDPAAAYPATLEAAVRAGEWAASSLVASINRP